MSRKLLVLISMLTLLIVPMTINAQEVAEGFDYCELVSDADCQIFTLNQEAMSTINSFSFDLSLGYDIVMDTGLPFLNNINFGVDGNGTLAFDRAIFDEINELSQDDAQTYLEQMPMLMDAMLSAFEGEMNLEVMLPDMLRASQRGEPSAVPVQLLFDDGIAVMNVAALSEVTGDESSDMEWVGIDLGNFYQTMLGGMDFSSMLDESDVDMTDMTDANIMNALTINRLADTNLNGQAVAVYEINFDYGEMLRTMGMADALYETYGDMGMNKDEVDAMLSTVDNLNMNMRQYVGLDDYYTYRIEVSMDTVMEGSMMGEFESESGGMQVDFNMSLDLNNFNIPVDVTLPEYEEFSPFDMLMGSGI